MSSSVTSLVYFLAQVLLSFNLLLLLLLSACVHDVCAHDVCM